ncbi:MAG: streptogramin lyase [Candidatus Latescibacterota bacterium]|jgi:streptogramin lyase
MKHLITALFLALTLSVPAQNFEDTWTGHFSYVSVKSISQGNGKIYAASENAVFIYDPVTSELSTLSTINGLAGELISTIYYSENFNLLIIGYENGLMDVVLDGEEEVLTVVDILEKPTIPPDKKRINHFNEYDGFVYISSKFGISLFDLAALEFGDSYFIGDLGSQLDITQTAILGPYIFASSADGGGVRRAFVNRDNLIDFEQWTTVVDGSYKGVQNLAGTVYILRTNDKVFQYNFGFPPTFIEDLNDEVVDFKVHNDLLTITTENTINAYSENYTLEASVTSVPEYDYILQSGLAFNSKFYLGTSENGMLEVPYGSNQAVQILPDGPALNQTFAIDASPGQVWTVFGEVDVNFNPFPLNKRPISNLRDGVWTNVSHEEIFDAIGDKNANDLVYVTINPQDPDQVFMSSFNKGLLKVSGQTPVKLYDETNSPLQTYRPPAQDIRIYGSDFDKDGNLWFVQSRIDNGLIKLNPNDQMQLIDITPAIEDTFEQLALSKLKVSREGYVFFGAVETGLVGYNPFTNSFNVIGNEAGSGNLPTPNVRALAFDKNNRLWIGTLKGIRVLFNPGGVFEENGNTETSAIIILEDNVPQEFLFDVPITDIEVDGSNNKWIATTTSGVFYVSPNGQETLQRFTKDNSPLPSNTVLDIAIDDFTGVVYFATINGLVAFNGSATAPRDNLENVYAYPNPVRPGFTGNVTVDGLTASANVKITDIEGNLVFEETSEGGSVLWDTTAFGKYRVASGVYLVLITAEDALETTVSKIMVIR